MPDGILKLKVVDVYGDAIREGVDIFLKNLSSAAGDVAIRNTKSVVTIKGLNQVPLGQYRIEVDAPSYLAVSRFLTIPSDGAAVLVITLPVNKDRVVGVNFPDFGMLEESVQRLLASSSLAGGSGAEIYAGWDDLRKAGFLNLTGKARSTRLLSGEPVIDLLQAITEQRGDRLFAIAEPGLHAEVLHSLTGGLFHRVTDELHIPAPGFRLVDSYKTDDHYGNLQLTFSSNGADWSVDMDIDDAQGFEHIFQVVRNVVIGQTTHPYNIHEILVQYQELDPGYTFNLARAPAGRGTTVANG